jgi:spore coat protein U-like protein
MKMRNKLLAALALFTMFSAMDANAQSSQTINVQAQVNPTCVINGFNTPIDFDFGPVDVTGGTNSTTSATFTWRCSTGTSVSIQLDAGDTLLSAPATARLLEGPTGDTISYRLCQDSACLTPWGDGTTADDIATNGTGMGNPEILTIHGVLDGTTAQNAPPGTYTETVVLSLVF